jgi:hypothetical protein
MHLDPAAVAETVTQLQILLEGRRTLAGLKPCHLGTSVAGSHPSTRAYKIPTHSTSSGLGLQHAPLAVRSGVPSTLLCGDARGVAGMLTPTALLAVASVMWQARHRPPFRSGHYEWGSAQNSGG